MHEYLIELVTHNLNLKVLKLGLNTFQRYNKILEFCEAIGNNETLIELDLDNLYRTPNYDLNFLIKNKTL